MGLADEQFISVSTFRKSGATVATPVWVVPVSGGRLGFTTAADTGKVKRLRNNPAVSVVPCSRSGKVESGAQQMAGTAQVVESGPLFAEVDDGVRGKYGMQARAAKVVSAVRQRVKRKPARRVAVVITPDT